VQLDLFREIIVDNFAGGGGASTGIEMATGLSVDIAINHDPAAIAMHKVNHPDTEHYCESVWEVDPREVVKGRKVALCWLSPDCKHFSKAKGGKPVNKTIRGLAWVAVRWAATVKPRVIILENVEEFKTWGPLKDGKPDPDKKGVTFQSFVRNLSKHGYQVEYKELKASDYGAPTIRKRFFLIARCDGKPIVWPEPTHGDPQDMIARKKGLKKWKTSGEIMDWSMPIKSIYNRKKPLVQSTMNRIRNGIEKYVLNNPKPFLLNQEDNLISPVLIQMGYGDPEGKRVLDLKKPLGTITAGGNKFAIAAAFLIKYYGQGVGQSLNEPLHTITTKDRFGLITVHGQDMQVADIGMRMLQPHELFKAQGFPDGYVIDRDINGVSYSKEKQLARCGNAVPPPFAEHLVRANLPELCSNDSKYKQAAVN
jgi:DNA (cytosine-5)-methyltransferase 1